MLPIIILVWGIVFYQLYGYFFASSKYAQAEVMQKIKMEDIKQDTFSIVADYRDPFLGDKIKEHDNNASNNTSSNSPKKVVEKKEMVADKPWPKVVYNGMIKNNNSNKKVGIITVNSKEYLAKVGEQFQEVTILEITKELIKVRFQKETKTINK